MITYINSSNAVDYNNLFTAVTDKLRLIGEDGKPVEETGLDPIWTADENITSLDELFSYMQYIAIAEPRYTRLPLDEEFFEIDLNSRVISVPKGFAQNGISVQGDEISEIVYFKCRRFFDATDLGSYDKDTKTGCQIFIQWKVMDGKEEINGVSYPWIHDIESEPGYLIFGWPLCHDITKNAGPVKFSVRFYIEEDEKVVYSLSTLDATVSVKPALDFNIGEMLREGSYCDNTDLISKRFKYVGITEGDGEKPGYPIFITTLPKTINLDENGEAKVYAVAVPPLNGSIGYQWDYRNLSRELSEEDYPFGVPEDKQAECSYEVVYVAAKEPQVSGKSYFLKEDIKNEEDSRQIFKPYLGKEIVKDDEGKLYAGTVSMNYALYERQSEAVLTSIGKYIVEASNRIGKNTTYSAAELDEEGTILESNLQQVVCVNYPNKPEFEINVEDDRALFEDGEATFVVVTADTEDAGKISYHWYKIIEDGYEAVNASNVKIVDEVQSLKGEDGFYRLQVVNTLNGAEDYTVSNIIRITKPASAPIVTTDAETERELGEGGEIMEVEVEYADDARIEEDSCTYQWYSYGYIDKDVFAEDFETSKAGAYEIKSADIAIDGATEAIYKAPKQGYYFCVVTNSYNNDKKTATSPILHVADNR